MAELLLPPGVHYTCIRCGQCCRSLEVTLTEREYDRLGRHDWSAEMPGHRPERAFARVRRPRGRQLWRLRPLPSGACRFLTGEGLCRVHATLGLRAKPFAGRLFPYTFVVTPVGVFVGVRFHCPAVVRGLGPQLEERREEIRRLFAEYERVYAPPRGGERVRFFGRYELAWGDVVQVEDQLLAFLRMRELDIPSRLLACRRLVRGFVSGAVRRPGSEPVGVAPDQVLAEVRGGAAEVRRPGALERTMLRLLVASFAGATLPSFRELALARRMGVRAGNLGRRVRMAVGRGRARLPELGAAPRIRDVEAVDLTAVGEGSAEMLERYFVAKVASQGFFGQAFFGRSFAEGLDFLVSAYGAIVWLAGACAVAGGRRELTAQDIEYGIRQVDYGFNYIAAFGGLADRVRALLFWQWETPEKLLAALRGSRQAWGQR